MGKLKPFANLAGLIVALAVIFIAFSLKLPQTFPTAQNLETLARQSAITILVSIGLTYVIVAGGIDLSVGSVAAFACVTVAATLKAGWAPIPAALAAVAAGTLAGLVNGVLITKLRVVPFIVTLGAMSLFRGAAKGVAKSETIDAPDTWLNNILAGLGKDEKWKIVPPGVWMAIVCAVVTGWALRYTRFGRHIVAIGSNENAARLCGVPIDRAKIAIYAISGFFAGLAGLLFFSRLTVGDPTIAVGLELDAIAAVVIGGASLSGGEGSILGSILGALIMATLRSGASQLHLDAWIQEVVTGVIIVLAVALDRFRKR